ncbi:helix-turn-helix domain-containing protein [Kitasatospora sp. NBC_01287]|uniref:helix-turn-helix domain-containing protein n=1 Tax=Kitasatospora sp. NBC_01287 TaxID=2903573 RepID=UPI002259E007|nr:helix-turn-helix domain-containing protein [Kitasatospora sp. NBC_01287]MCX4749692.1 helix-turn-helix domain-containing protein [Kitasatospora sp. NBC_01287]
MTTRSVRSQALLLLRAGKSNVEVARMLAVPRGTVGAWKHYDRAERGELPGRKRSICPHCYGDELNAPAYSYLLGLYLGDGHIVHPKQHRTHNLAITCDNKWPGVMDSVEQAMRDVLPTNTPCRVRRTGCKDVKVYSQHLTCLFPQHGPGKKFERPIILEPWQQDIVNAHPWGLLRGLIHSDGCRIVNWATRTVNGVVRRHEYPRYFFTNKSTDIIGIFTNTLDSVGVEWKAARRTNGAVNISIARRASIALMDQHIGPKY